ncbi:UNVERIFIED_CONTAM: LytR family transcriptional attenuator [Acetivibrio alkalicellulosi]
MNFRKFYFIVCSVLSVFMFSIGLLMLVYINVTDVFGQEEESKLTENQETSFIGGILDPFRTNQMKSINVLLLGGDEVGGLTDTMMVVNFNPSTAQINVLSIPRDTQMRLNNRIKKINELYRDGGGGEFAVEFISEILQTDVEYYAHVSLSAFRDIIDILGGVNYYVPVDMYYRDPLQNLTINFQKGDYHFKGEDAEKFMRFRQYNSNRANEYYDGSDVKRIEAQQGFIKELIRQKANMFYITRINEILNVVFNTVETNLSMSEVLKMTSNLNNINADQINMFTLPGRPAYQNRLSYWIMDIPETMEIVDDHFVIKNIGNTN